MTLISAAISAASYNNLNQLTNASGGGPMRFKGHLDELGTVTVAGANAPVESRTTNFVGYASVNAGTNVIPIVATDYSGNVRSNRYQVVVTNNGVAKTLAYDHNGNLTNVTTPTYTNTYEWDGADRLVAINGPTNRSEFTYDGLGRRERIVEKTNGVTQSDKRFLWCEARLCEERDSTGANVAKRLFGQGEQISGVSYFFRRDHLGSIREMTDSGGAIRARYDYEPYGRKTKISGDLEADFGFTGHYFHAPSGLHLALYRAYDASAGRWPNRDPIGEAGGLNLYEFVGNDPINRVDPFGLSPSDVEDILNTYNKTISQMNADGHRVGWLPPLSSLNSDLYPWGNKKGWECVSQSQFVCKKLNYQSQRDDEWTIKTVTSPNLMHTWVEATSMNPGDPKIKLDPWWGYTSLTPNTIQNAPLPSPISNVNVNNIPVNLPIPGYFPR